MRIGTIQRVVTVVKLFSCKKGPTFILQRISTEIEFKGLCCLGWSINNSFEGIMNNDRISFYGTARRTESSARLNQEQILSQGSVMEEKFDNLIRCVNYIQEQSDEAISLGDSVNRAVGEIMNRMEIVDLKIRALESSNIANTSTTPTSSRLRSRLPREVSVSLLHREFESYGCIFCFISCFFFPHIF